jgi:hypothetical protein
MFDTLEQLENGIPSDKVIILKSVFKNSKTTVMPAEDGRGWYLGVPRYSEEDKRKLVYWAEPTSKCVIKDGQGFDLNRESDRVTWEWVKHASCICKTKEQVQHTPGAEFYIHLENQEAKQNVSRYELKFKANEYIIKDNSVNYPMRVELLGVNMDHDSPIIIKEFLMEMADKHPEKIISVYNSRDISARLLLLKGLKKKVIFIADGGLYTYGSNVLGTTERSAINWLMSPENKEIVKVLESEISPSYFPAEKSLPTTDKTEGQGPAKRG